MTKRWRVLIPLALGVAPVAFIWLTIRSQWLPPEPVYQGKPLTYWLPHVIMENPNGVRFNHEHYREAVASAGTQASRFVFAKLRKNDSNMADHYRNLWPRLPAILKRYLPQPKPQDYFAQDAASALMCLGTNAIPDLEEAMTDSSPAVRQAAAQALCGFSGDALSVSDSARIFGRAIKDSDPGVRLFAAFGLSRIGAAASNSVPALIQALSGPETGREPGMTFLTRASAAYALGAMGSPAASAIPVLKNLLPSQDADTKCIFTNSQNALASSSGVRQKPVMALREVSLPPTPSGKLELWLRADAGVVTNKYGRIHEWQDQSGNHNNAVQPCDAMEPLLVFPPEFGGRAAVRFDGIPVFGRIRWGGHLTTIGPYLKSIAQVDVPGDMTTFCVYKMAAPSSLERVVWFIGEANPPEYGQCRGDMVTAGRMRFTEWAYEGDTPFFVSPDIYRIRANRVTQGGHAVEMFDTTPSETARFTGAILGARATRPGYFIGGFDPDETFGRNLNGDIAELLIYQGAMSDGDMQAVTDYLRQKYFPEQNPRRGRP